MKKFQFKFDAVLRVRKVQENDTLTALAASQRAYQTELAHKAKLKEDLGAALLRRESLGEKPVKIQSFHSEQSFIVGLKQRIIRADQAIFRASKQVEKALRAYLFARKQTRVIEILYDRAYVEYRKEKSKYEQKATEDILLMRTRFKEDVI